MLILIYLVSILSQPNAARSSDYSDVRPIENSQKLMLRIPTEMPSNFENLFSTKEALTTTIDNFIPKTSSYFETHPLFPIQKQTTASMDFEQTTKPSLARETTAETSVIPNPEYTIPLENEFSFDETKMWQSTTESLPVDTTPHSSQSEENETTNSPNATTEITFNSTPISTDIPESDDLFIDNWPVLNQPLKIEDSQINPPDEKSFPLSDIKEPSPESFFLNDDNEFSATIAPASVHHESESTPKSNEEVLSSIEEMGQSQGVLSNAKVNKNKMVALETPSIFAPGNFFNLFNMDHIPATSNRKAIWWSKPMNAPSPVKGRKRHTNGIHPIYESEEVNETPMLFNRLFNRKLEDSVNFLERFFGNLVMQ